MENIHQFYIQSALTIIGWFIAAFWAVKQVEKSNESNSHLQRLLLQESHRQYLARELNEAYKPAMANIDDFIQSLSFLVIIYGKYKKGYFANNGFEKVKESIDALYSSQSQMTQDFCKLDVWLNTMGSSIELVGDIRLYVAKYYELMVLNVSEMQSQEALWINIHLLLENIDEKGEVDYAELRELSSNLIVELVKVRGGLSDSIGLINVKLCGEYS
ncbi:MULTISPECIES: hypothetical protein [Vibrio]|uniref:hypothetical protein n=1 Tax=Vibrio TaxID=662 RepID=UPI0005F0742F|nr:MULTISPECIES: hypothetical protein [Vibrio]KJR29590.1 hypothetical protein UF06_10835 [Vibrio sp. S234-5]MBE4605800.1 hypothetical protein [Vibrio navarrensis]